MPATPVRPGHLIKQILLVNPQGVPGNVLYAQYKYACRDARDTARQRHQTGMRCMSYASFHKRIHEARLLGFLDIASYGEVVYTQEDKSGPPLLSMTEESYPNTQIRLSRPSYYVLTGLGRMAVSEWDNLTKAVRITGYGKLDTAKVQITAVPPLVLPTQRLTVTSAPGVVRQLQELDALRLRVAPEDTDIHEALENEIDTLRTSLGIWLEDLAERLETSRIQRVAPLRDAVTERLGKLKELETALGAQGAGFPDLTRAIEILQEIEPMQRPREITQLPRERRPISRERVTPQPLEDLWITVNIAEVDRELVAGLVRKLMQGIPPTTLTSGLEAPDEPWIRSPEDLVLEIKEDRLREWLDRLSGERGFGNQPEERVPMAPRPMPSIRTRTPPRRFTDTERIRSLAHFRGLQAEADELDWPDFPNDAITNELVRWYNSALRWLGEAGSHPDQPLIEVLRPLVLALEQENLEGVINALEIE